MPDKSRSRRPALLGNHQRCWLWGRHLVRETVQAGRWPILELFLQSDLDEGEREAAAAAVRAAGVPVRYESRAALERRCRHADHQGYVARMAPFAYACLESILEPQKPDTLLLVLDRIQDPYNLGAMIRSAEVFGVQGIVVGEREQAEVNSLAARASAGAVNRVRIARTRDAAAAVREIQARGLPCLASRPGAPRDLRHVEFVLPGAIVIGNESQGLSPETAAECRLEAAIPQWGRIGSLNAAAAAAVLLYEARRRGERPPETAPSV